MIILLILFYYYFKYFLHSFRSLQLFFLSFLSHSYSYPLDSRSIESHNLLTGLLFIYLKQHTRKYKNLESKVFSDVERRRSSVIRAFNYSKKEKKKFHCWNAEKREITIKGKKHTAMSINLLCFLLCYSPILALLCFVYMEVLRKNKNK